MDLFLLVFGGAALGGFKIQPLAFHAHPGGAHPLTHGRIGRVLFCRAPRFGGIGETVLVQIRSGERVPIDSVCRSESGGEFELHGVILADAQKVMGFGVLWI